MSDELLEQLGRLDAEARPAAPWDEVLEGRRSASDVVEQLRPGAEDEGELEALAEASRPVEAAERAAWARRLRAKLDEPAEEGEGSSPSDAVPKGEAAGRDHGQAPSDAEVRAPIPLEPSRRRGASRAWWWGAVPAAMAAAAGVLLWMRGTAPHEPDPGGVTMPSFMLEIRNDTVGEIRGGSEGTQEGPFRYQPRSAVHWMVRPAKPVATGVELALLVEGEGELACLRRPAIARASEDGVFLLRGSVHEVLGLGPGQWSLGFIVAPKGSLPADPASGECVQPRTVPCPCPPLVERGAVIERAQSPGRATKPAWVRVEPTYSMQIEPV